MQINHRVRGLLLTPRNTLMLIRRIREGVEPYYVVPGGGVEPSDVDLHAALRREIREELGGEIEILREVFSTNHPGSNDLDGWTVMHHYFLCRLLSYDISLRNGPEFLDPTKGQYEVAEFPLVPESFAKLNMLPSEMGVFLTENIQQLITS